MTRIADPARAAEITRAERAWWRVTRPVTSRIGDEVAHLDLAGARVACFHHVVADATLMLQPLVRAGALVRVAAVNPESTDDAGAALLAAEGAEVWAWSGMTDAEVQEGLEWLLSEPADALSDMGGELIAATAERGATARGALEATRSGLHRLDRAAVSFPVRFGGPGGRPARPRPRGLGLGGGGRPVRALEALHHGCRVVPLAQGLGEAQIVVTVTGVEGALGHDELGRLRRGAIVCNVGHSNREIDVAWLDTHPNDQVRRHVRRYELDGREVFLLNRGNMVNLAPGAGVATDELFDPLAALVLRGLAWVLTGGADGAPPGVLPYPAELEREIAELTLAARR